MLSPQTKMTPQTRMGVMSMSKTVTAAALVASMPWMSVKPDSLIGPLARLGVWRLAVRTASTSVTMAATLSGR